MKNFIEGEYYHIFNRGIDGKTIFESLHDVDRFYQSLVDFNSKVPVGSIYENSFIRRRLGNPISKLDGNENIVDIIAYCLNPNHFHLILRQKKDNGIGEFIRRVSLGYTKYFNNKNKRRGHLFSGAYKHKHIDSNEYLLHLSVYVNLNDRVHQLGNPISKLVQSRSSVNEYFKGWVGICEKDIVMDQFKNIEEYRLFSEDLIGTMIEKKELIADLED